MAQSDQYLGSLLTWTTHAPVTNLLGWLDAGNGMAAKSVLSLAWDTYGLHHGDLLFNMSNILLASQILYNHTYVHCLSRFELEHGKAHDVGSLG